VLNIASRGQNEPNAMDMPESKTAEGTPGKIGDMNMIGRTCESALRHVGMQFQFEVQR